MEDILKIEKEISLIREDIESTEGRLRYLNNQVGYRTLIITYYDEKSNRTAIFYFGGKMAEHFSNGGMGFLWFLSVVLFTTLALSLSFPMWLIGSFNLVYNIQNRKTSEKSEITAKTIQ